MSLRNTFFIRMLFVFTPVIIFGMHHNDKKETKGRIVFNRLINFIKNQEKDEEKLRIANLVASNIVGLSSYEMTKNEKIIYDKLAGKLSGVVSFFVRSFTGLNFNAFSKNKEDIQQCIQKFLLRKSNEDTKIDDIEDNLPKWFLEEIKSFEAQKREERISFTEILCVATRIAIDDEKMFKKALEKARCYSMWHGKFHSLLSSHVEIVEKEIEGLYYENECEENEGENEEDESDGDFQSEGCAIM